MKEIKKILIVEDDSDLLDLYVDLLEGEGYKVTTAENGEEALNILKQEKEGFDLLLTDEIVPKIQGTELIRIIDESKDITKPKNIIPMTNLDKESIQVKLKPLKSNLIKDYIIKSELTPIDFIEKINKVLN